MIGPKWGLMKQVGILSLLVSKLRAVAKNSSKNCRNEQKQVFGPLFLEENSRFAKFKFFTTKVMGKWDG